MLFPGMIHCILNQENKTKFGNEALCVQFLETKKLLTHFDPFPNKTNKRTTQQ
jgi:hypothetical protein